MKYKDFNKNKDRIINVSEYKGNPDLRNLMQSQIAKTNHNLGSFRYIAVAQDYYEYLTKEGFKTFNKSTIESDLTEIIKENNFCETYVVIDFLSRNFGFSASSYNYSTRNRTKALNQVMQLSKDIVKKCKEKGISHPYVSQIEKLLNREYKGMSYIKADNLYEFLDQKDGYSIKATLEKMPTLKEYIDSSCKKAKTELKLSNMEKFQNEYPLAFDMFMDLIVGSNDTPKKLEEFKKYFELSV